MPDLMVAKDNVDNGVRRGGDEHADQLGQWCDEVLRPALSRTAGR